MACAVPPIATATATATGWLVPPDGPDALAHSLTTALRDTAQRTHRADNARTHVEDTYSWTARPTTTSPPRHRPGA
ncbi:hypothetical protein GCM10010304_70000 [Streptomyces roseoviolaceus]